MLNSTTRTDEGRARVEAVRTVRARRWESGDWITSMHPTWRGREQKITAVLRNRVQVTDYREDGTHHNRGLRWLPADIRLARKGATDAS